MRKRHQGHHGPACIGRAVAGGCKAQGGAEQHFRPSEEFEPDEVTQYRYTGESEGGAGGGGGGGADAMRYPLMRSVWEEWWKSCRGSGCVYSRAGNGYLHSEMQRQSLTRMTPSIPAHSRPRLYRMIYALGSSTPHTNSRACRLRQGSTVSVGKAEGVAHVVAKCKWRR